MDHAGREACLGSPALTAAFSRSARWEMTARKTIIGVGLQGFVSPFVIHQGG